MEIVSLSIEAYQLTIIAFQCTYHRVDFRCRVEGLFLPFTHNVIEIEQSGITRNENNGDGTSSVFFSLSR